MGRYNSSLNSTAMTKLRVMQRAGMISCNEVVLKRGQTLQRLAGQFLGDSNLWWVLAAISNIGFATQVPPGTVIKIPQEIQKLFSIIGVG